MEKETSPYHFWYNYSFSEFNGLFVFLTIPNDFSPVPEAAETHIQQQIAPFLFCNPLAEPMFSASK